MQPELEIELKPFEMLHSLLDELQKQLMKATFATASLLLLGIGWFASEDVAAFLKEHPRFAWIVVLAPLVGSALYCYSARLIYKRSQKIAATLKHFDVTLANIYQSSAVSRTQFLVFSAGVLLLAVILAGCIYLAVHSPVEEPNEDEVLMQVALPRSADLSRAPHLMHQIYWHNTRTASLKVMILKAGFAHLGETSVSPMIRQERPSKRGFERHCLLTAAISGSIMPIYEGAPIAYRNRNCALGSLLRTALSQP